MDPGQENIFLVGMMGSGKTTIGRHLARRYKKRFVDSDHEIEARTGVTIPVIFEIEGEAGFRRREAAMIAELTGESGLVLATGGGAVLDPDNRHSLHSRGTVVYLCVPPRVLFERTSRDRNRPLLQVSDPLARLEQIYAERDPLYRETAHIVVDGGRINASAMIKRIDLELQRLCTA